MMALVLVILAGSAYADEGSKDALLGSWQGVVNVSTGSFHVVFHILKNTDGGFQSTIDRPDRKEFGVKADVTLVQERKFHCEVKKYGIVFDGTLNSKGYLVGVWKQDGTALPLILGR
jgi:hypothetical protein